MLPSPAMKALGSVVLKKTDGVEGTQTDCPSIYLHGPHGLSDTRIFQIRKEESQKTQ